MPQDKDPADDGPEVGIIRREMQLAAEALFGPGVFLMWTCWDIDDRQVPYHIRVTGGPTS